MNDQKYYGVKGDYPNGNTPGGIFPKMPNKRTEGNRTDIGEINKSSRNNRQTQLKNDNIEIPTPDNFELGSGFTRNDIINGMKMSIILGLPASKRYTNYKKADKK